MILKKMAHPEVPREARPRTTHYVPSKPYGILAQTRCSAHPTALTQSETAVRRILALCSGMPVSSKQTRAKAATPSRMTSFDGSAKQSRRCDLLAAALHDHSGPGLKTTPALAAGPTSLVTSTRSGNLSHRKIPPFGYHIFSTAVPNSRSTASTIASSLSCKVCDRPPTCASKLCEKYSATTI